MSEPELDKLERRVRGMNGMARIQRAVMASVPMAQVLGIGGFDLTRALEYKPTFLDPEYPFEWAGVYNCVAGEHVLELQPGPDPQMSMVLMPFEASSLVEAAERVFPIFSTEPAQRAVGLNLSCGPEHQRLTLTGGTTMRFPISIAKPGRYALFAQHLPEEFELRWIGAPLVDQHTFAPAHTHDEAVTSVALTVREPLHRERFETWLGRLLQLQGTDLFRLKGFLHLAESPRRTVIQGVHMLVDTHTDDGWGNSPPMTQLVLIGRNLDRDTLDAELRSCAA